MITVFETEIISDDTKKCGGCGYRASVFYATGISYNNAIENAGEIEEDYGRGICCHCLAEMLVELNLNSGVVLWILLKIQ